VEPGNGGCLGLVKRALSGLRALAVRLVPMPSVFFTFESADTPRVAGSVLRPAVACLYVVSALAFALLVVLHQQHKTLDVRIVRDGTQLQAKGYQCSSISPFITQEVSPHDRRSFPPPRLPGSHLAQLIAWTRTPWPA
jgi:hypothetical protein